MRRENGCPMYIKKVESYGPSSSLFSPMALGCPDDSPQNIQNRTLERSGCVFFSLFIQDVPPPKKTLPSLKIYIHMEIRNEVFHQSKTSSSSLCHDAKHIYQTANMFPRSCSGCGNNPTWCAQSLKSKQNVFHIYVKCPQHLYPHHK